MLEFLGIEIKYLAFIVITLVTIIAYYYTKKNYFILFGVLLIIMSELYLTECKSEFFVEPIKTTPIQEINIINPPSEPLNDNTINNKIHRNMPSVLWERNEAIRETYPFATTSEPPDSTTFAKWCYGMDDMCKSGAIYMNTPILSSKDRTTCTGTNY